MGNHIVLSADRPRMIPRPYLRGTSMRVIPWLNFKMSMKDEAGGHTILDVQCPCGKTVCASFDCNGARQGGCELLKIEPTGVRGCLYQKQVEV